MLRGPTALLLLSAALGCAHAPTARAPDDAIAAVRTGALDQCASDSWARLRFADDPAAFAALREAVTRADEGAKSDWAYSEADQRVRGLRQTLDGLADAATETEWNSARDAAETRVAAAASEARAHQGADYAAIRARLNVWNRAAEAATAYWRDGSRVQWHALDCVLAPRLRAARLEYGRALAEMVEQGQWPSSALHGPRAEFGALNASAQYFAADEIAQVCERLCLAASRDDRVRGMWALMRSKIECDPELPMSAADYVARYESESPLVARFLESLPQDTMAQQIRRRTALEQFGRSEVGRFHRTYAPDEREAFAARMWAPVAAADRDNTAWLQGVLAERDWFDDSVDGAGAQSEGWLLIQHADHDPDFQRGMLRRLEPHLSTGRISRSNYALLWDRVAVKDGRPQRYGTQMACREGEWIADEGVEDPDDLDARRAAFDLQPWQEYQAQIARIGGACVRS